MAVLQQQGRLSSAQSAIGEHSDLGGPGLRDELRLVADAPTSVIPTETPAPAPNPIHPIALAFGKKFGFEIQQGHFKDDTLAFCFDAVQGINAGYLAESLTELGLKTESGHFNANKKVVVGDPKELDYKDRLVILDTKSWTQDWLERISSDKRALDIISRIQTDTLKGLAPAPAAQL